MIKNKLNWLIFAAAAVVIAAACLFIFWPGERIVTVVSVEGAASVSRSGNASGLSVFEGMRINPEDIITTEAGSSVMLSIDDNKLVRIADNTVVTFEEISNHRSGQVTQLHLEKGTLINDVQEKLTNNAAYRISTPNATVSVRGTYFTVHVGEAEGYTGLITTVNVYQGSVEVETSTGEIAVLYADKNSSMQITSSLTLPSGNRAIIGLKEVTVFESLDYEHLNEGDFERLKEIAAQEDSVLDPAVIMEHLNSLSGAPTEESGAEQASEAIELPKTPNNGFSDDSGDNNETASESEGSLLPKAPVSESAAGSPPLIDLPLSPSELKQPDSTLAADSIPSGSGGNNSGSSSGSGGNSSSTPEQPPAPDEETPPAPDPEQPPAPDEEMPPSPDPEQPPAPDEELPPENTEEILKEQQAAYAPVQLTIPNYDTVNASVQELTDRINAWEVSGLPLTPEVTAAKAQVDTAAALLSDMDAANNVLSQINALKYPIQITADDRVSVETARSAYNGLSASSKALIPSNMAEKLSKCEAALTDNQ